MVKVAQVGCGHWGKNLARNFAQLGHLAAIVEGNPETAASISQEHGVPARSFEDVLSDKDISAIALATPAELHAAQAKQALEAGKHCYVEKPLALDIRHAQELITLAKDKDLRLMVGHLLQYHPIFIECLKRVRAGEIGNPHYIYSNRMSLGKFRTEENVLWSFAPHDISMLLALAGEEPDYITAQGMAHVTDNIADFCTLQMRFPSGLRGHVQTSWLHPFKEQRLVIIGEKATLVFEDSQPEWDKKLALYPYQLQRSDPMVAPVPVKGEVQYIAVEKGEPLKNECQHFVESIAQNSQPRTDGGEGLAVLRVLDAAEKALQENLSGQAA